MAVKIVLQNLLIQQRCFASITHSMKPLLNGSLVLSPQTPDLHNKKHNIKNITKNITQTVKLDLQ